MLNVDAIRDDFPILGRRIGNHPLIYLDNAATTQKPRQVLETITHFYSTHNSNIHRSPHRLGIEASELYTDARRGVARFIGADDAEEIVFVRNTTEAANLVAHSLSLAESGDLRLSPGDEVIVTVMEHHSNLVPWQRACDRTGAALRVIGVHDDGTLDLDELRATITERTRLVCCTHVSNVLGTVNPVREIRQLAHDAGALVFLDAAQSVPHMPVDVKSLGCDFLAFSGHKMLAPMGTGVLYGRRKLLNKMAPFLTGGGMVEHVTQQRAIWTSSPLKFEAGTPDVAGAIALGGATDWLGGGHLEGAVDYLTRLGMAEVHAHESELASYVLDELCTMDRVRVFGPLDPNQRSGIVTFIVKGSDAHTVAMMLNDEGIAVRSGDHCGFPLAERLGVPGTLRASFYVYNSMGEVQRFVEVLDDIVKNRLI